MARKTSTDAAGAQGAMGVVDAAVACIRHRIAEGAYLPGQRLVEPELMAALGVSRAALREAVVRLAAEGLLELERYRGASVRRLDRAAVAEMFEVRATLEGLAARRAAPVVAPSAPLRTELRGIMAALEATDADAPDPTRAYVLANARLHGFVLHHARAPTLARLVPPLQMPLLRLTLARLLDARSRADSQAGHRIIAAALEAGDAAAAEAAMRSHVALSASAILALPDRHFG